MIFPPTGFTRYRIEIAAIIGGTRGPHEVRYRSIDGNDDRGYTAHLDPASDQPDRLMGESGRRDQQSRLDVIAIESLGYCGSQSFCHRQRIRHKAANAPPNIIQFSDHCIGHIFLKPVHWHKRVSILPHGCRIIALSGILNVLRIHGDWDLAEARVVLSRFNVERVRAVNVSSRRGY